MKTSKDSTRAEVFAFLEGKILEIDELLGKHQYMMIGSYARDIHLEGSGLKSPRGTQDLNLSVAAESFFAFNEILESFGAKHGVVTRRELSGTPIDIIPFGAIGNGFSQGGSHWELRGLAEAYKAAEVLELGKASVKITPIHAMMGLKIISWGERLFPTDCTEFHYLLMSSNALSLDEESGDIWESEVWDD